MEQIKIEETETMNNGFCDHAVMMEVVGYGFCMICRECGIRGGIRISVQMAERSWEQNKRVYGKKIEAGE